MLKAIDALFQAYIGETMFKAIDALFQAYIGEGYAQNI